MVTVQTLPVVDVQPDQPENDEPVAGVAVSVVWLFSVKKP